MSSGKTTRHPWRRLALGSMSLSPWGRDPNAYEERVTLWPAGNFEEAIAPSEMEVEGHCWTWPTSNGSRGAAPPARGRAERGQPGFECQFPSRGIAGHSNCFTTPASTALPAARAAATSSAESNTPSPSRSPSMTAVA